LPDVDIEGYLKGMLDLKWMPTDEDLVNYMEEQIDGHMRMKRSKSDAPTAD
jgi:hypothetical protein